MTLAVGDKIPDGTLLKMGETGAEPVEIGPLLAGRKVVLFGLPGAFTGTCTTAHMPSFIRTRAGFAEKGVDEVICVTVNDPFVSQAWDEATGAGAGGVTILADPSGAFVKAMGMDFDVPAIGFHGRCTRFSSLVDDGEVKIVKMGDKPGACEIAAGETLLADM